MPLQEPFRCPLRALSLNCPALSTCTRADKDGITRRRRRGERAARRAAGRARGAEGAGSRVVEERGRYPGSHCGLKLFPDKLLSEHWVNVPETSVACLIPRAIPSICGEK